MDIDYTIYEYQYDKRNGNLDSEAKSVVKSKKHFPYFYIDGKKIIYKPLSKTKPLSTPYFAYSEVVWSTIIHNYFDDKAPIYHLARCLGYEEEVPKYHRYGTVVESIVNEDEHLINLYEYFQKYPDKSVNITNYKNYCLEYYDYSFFFESQLFKDYPNIGREIAKQILYSILRADENYHYENVSLIQKNNEIISVASPIDHEFSIMFMYLDNPLKHISLFGEYISSILKEHEIDSFKKILRNIDMIVRKYPDVVQDFIKSLDKMIEELNIKPILLEDHGYITPFSSDDFEEGILRYKENDLIEADKMLQKINRKEVLVNEVNQHLNKEISFSAQILKKTLENRLR